MKTCCLFVLLCLFTLPAFAQKPVKWGLQAGLNISSFAAWGSDFDDIRTERHSVSGFQAGLTATVPFTKNLLLHTGLQVERRGFAFEINQNNIHYEALYRPYYLQVPAVLTLTNGRVYAGAGLYIAYGLGGTFHSEWSAQGNSLPLPAPQNRDLIWGNNAAQDDFSRWDGGLQFEAGLSIKRFGLAGTFALGMANIQPHPDASQVVKLNRVFSLVVRYFIIAR